MPQMWNESDTKYLVPRNTTMHILNVKSYTPVIFSILDDGVIEVILEETFSDLSIGLSHLVERKAVSHNSLQVFILIAQKAPTAAQKIRSVIHHEQEKDWALLGDRFMSKPKPIMSAG